MDEKNKVRIAFLIKIETHILYICKHLGSYNEQEYKEHISKLKNLNSLAGNFILEIESSFVPLINKVNKIQQS